MHTPALELKDIQGDVLIGLQKNAELFLFFKIIDPVAFKASMRRWVVSELTTAFQTRRREQLVHNRQRMGEPPSEAWRGLNLGFTNQGLSQLLGPQRPPMEPAFERGADHPDTIKALHDPERSAWLQQFLSDRLDGVLLITGWDRRHVSSFCDRVLSFLDGSLKIVYSEMGSTRPGRERGREHFGFLDGISQPGIRGLDRPSRPSTAPDQGLPGQDLLWPGEFLLGYPRQDPKDPRKPGPITPLPAPWARNGSYMVLRRLEQRVPEFRRFVRDQAARLGVYPELLASRMLGRWRSGAPMLLAPREDNVELGGDEKRNNNFDYADDPFQRACPYAAHIRKANPRDDPPEGKAETLRHRILRAGIPFGPEVTLGETKTMHSRGLMFVCYQASIERQFELIQRRYVSEPNFVGGKRRPGGGEPVTPGYDPIVGQAPKDGPRSMDEPAPNYPAGNRRTTLEMHKEFVTLTAAGYFFMPSITALHTVLT